MSYWAHANLMLKNRHFIHELPNVKNYPTSHNLDSSQNLKKKNSADYIFTFLFQCMGQNTNDTKSLLNKNAF